MFFISARAKQPLTLRLKLMEFPELGTHCSSPTCSRLDFLPFECDACHKIFCKEHGPYDKHHCELAYTKDARVPVCPLCNQPVPVSKGEDPNIKVDRHMQNECKSEKAKNISSRCSVPGCKRKELVPVKCNTCQKNFCLKHRFETDHNCQGHPQRLGDKSVPKGVHSRGQRASSGTRGGAPQKTALSHIGADLNRERMMRLQQKRPSATPHSSASQPTTLLAEDEAMALAIAASIGDSTSCPIPSPSSQPSPQAHPLHTNNAPSPTTIDEDADLARAIAASLNDQDHPKPKPAKKTTSNPRTREKSAKESDTTCTIS